MPAAASITPPNRNTRVSPSPDFTELVPVVLVEVVLVVEEELLELEPEELEPPELELPPELEPPPLPPSGFFQSTVLPDSLIAFSMSAEVRPRAFAVSSRVC